MEHSEKIIFNSAKSKKQLRLERKASRRMEQERQQTNTTMATTSTSSSSTTTTTNTNTTTTRAETIIKKKNHPQQNHRKKSLKLAKYKIKSKRLEPNMMMMMTTTTTTLHKKCLASKEEKSQFNIHHSKNPSKLNSIPKQSITPSQLEIRDATILEDLFPMTRRLDSTTTKNGTTNVAFQQHQRVRWGVQYRDIILGTGMLVEEQSTIVVAYRMTSPRKKGLVLDSSPRFQVTLGKGHVLQGWEIGIPGMRVGGKRSILVPPKAGYGSKDVGAGPGAILCFDIKVLSCR
jgi:hypothetical protein